MTSRTTRDDAQALFDGQAPAGSGLASIGAFFAALRDVAPAHIPQALEDRHQAAIRRALADAGRQTGREASWTSLSLRSLVAPVAVKVAALTLFVLLTGGTLAATGHLPVWQDQVADAVDFVVDLPGGSDEDLAEDASGDAAEAGDDDGDAAADAADADRDGSDGGGEENRESQTARSSGTSTTDPEDGSEGSGDQDSESSGDDGSESTEGSDESDDDQEGGDPEPSDDDLDLEGGPEEDDLVTDAGPQD